MSVAAGGMSVLADMPEPGPGGVAFEAGEFSRKHDLDGPDLCHGNRKQQACSATCDSQFVPCPQPARHVDHNLPFRTDMAGHQIDRWRAAQSDIVRRASRIERAEVHRRRHAGLAFEHGNIGRGIESEVSEALRRELARWDLARRLADIHKPKRGVEMRGKLGRHGVLRTIDRPSTGLATKRDAVWT